MPKIDPEYKRLLPSLTPEEYNGLQEDIEKHGCLEPAMVWNDTIVDGMNRWEICAALGISCPTKQIDFFDADEAKEWMIRHQMGRRNLTAGQRATLAAQLAATRGPGRPNNSANLRDEKSIPIAAKEMHVSPRAVNQARAVITDGSPKLQEAVRDGKIPVSTAAKIVHKPKAEQTRLASAGKAAVAKAAKEAATPKPIEKDAEGVAIPDLPGPKAGFARVPEVRGLMREVSALKGRLTKLAVKTDPIFGRLDVSAIQADLQHVYACLKAVMPHAVCPHCQGGEAGAGENCSACEGRGWLDEFSYRVVPQELKA